MNELEEADEDVDKISPSRIKQYIALLKNNIDM
jgi:hypothetical protein